MLRNIMFTGQIGENKRNEIGGNKKPPKNRGTVNISSQVLVCTPRIMNMGAKCSNIYVFTVWPRESK